MKLLLLAYGSRGDVQPYVALGQGLQAAGYDVAVQALDDYTDLIESHGLEAWPLGVSMADGNLDLFQGSMDMGRDTIRAVPTLIRSMHPLFQRMLSAIEEGCAAADGVIASLVGMAPGHAVAEARRIPYMAAVLQPFGRTRHFPSPAFPLDLPDVGALNAFTHRVVEQIYALSVLPYVNEWRVDHLGLPPQRPLTYPYFAINGAPVPWLYGYSPHVVPRPADWPSARHVTGYWFLPSAQPWTPPADLLAFLDAGPPPVYVGFGSMTAKDPAAITALVVAALAKAGQRGVLMTGWGGVANSSMIRALGGTDLPDTVYALDAAPHDWLFPRMAAVVHHGGAGTTAAGLRAGVPSIIVPFFGDQPFWGSRVAALGVGPTPIPRQALTADGLAYAIRVAVAHAPMRGRAAALGEAIRAEDGVSRAVDVVAEGMRGQRPEARG